VFARYKRQTPGSGGFLYKLKMSRSLICTISARLGPRNVVVSVDQRLGILSAAKEYVRVLERCGES
jgi:hypothetical protein